MAKRPFFLPGDGKMNLQFFHVNDLCRFMDILMEKTPGQSIFNVGNREPVSIRDWVTLCYAIAGEDLKFQNVSKEIEQRDYFSFYPYEYYLSVEKQMALMPDTKPLTEGIKESFEWYLENRECVIHDGYESIGAAMGKCTELIFVSRCCYGSVSPFVKMVQDREHGL